MKRIYFTQVHDLKDSNDPHGRSYKEVNAEKTHAIPLGTLVEIACERHPSNGARAFVVSHERDCDMTPLYSLSLDPLRVEGSYGKYTRLFWYNGWSEDSLEVIKHG